jgi:cellulose synthase/poly-beta-1,6-N-acetylglucosamine synthase-like glycosyltransferase
MISTILYIIDIVAFVVLALCVVYMLFFSVASLFYRVPQFPAPKRLGKIAVLFPAYKEDRVIVNSVTEFLKQDYPKERYDVYVISDQMKPETIEALESLPIKVLKVTFEKSSKAKAMAFATDQIKALGYDIVAIMDADNTTEPNFLSRVNEAIESGIGAIQAYRTGKESTSDVAKLDGVSENINNGMFRSGHNAVGLSAGLSGSGMAFKAEWFFENIYKLNTAGEDKEMEALLLKQRIHIIFIKDVHVFDEKVAKVDAIGNQRKRWMAAQYAILRRTIVDFPSALLHGNIDYCDKIVQWMLPPRLIQLFLLGLFTLLSLITLEPTVFVKWIVLCVLQVAAMLIPLPKKIFSMSLLKAVVIKIPSLIFVTLKGVFKMKGAHKDFIHTEHGDK